MKSGQIVELNIVDTAFGGDGVARDSSGRVVFIPMAITGEKVRVRIVEVKKNFARAELLELVEASTEREEPLCMYYGVCGGCCYQHINYAAELAIKDKQVRDLLLRIGKLSDFPLSPIIGSPQPYAYRNRISVHLGGGKIGFYAGNGRELVDIEHCHLANESVNKRLAGLRGAGADCEHISLRDETVSSSGFIQANALLSPQLLELVQERIDTTCDSWVEGYGGEGFFTRLFADLFEKVAMIELAEASSARARKSLNGVHVLTGDCSKLLPEAVALLGGEATGCFMDPPREGLTDEVVEHLCSYPYKQLIYLSCNPATLARDIDKLSVRWRLVSLQPIDLFPRTSHIECLVVFKPGLCTTNPEM